MTTILRFLLAQMARIYSKLPPQIQARFQTLLLRLEMKALKLTRRLTMRVLVRKLRASFQPLQEKSRLRALSENCPSFWAGVKLLIAHAAEREAANRAGMQKPVPLVGPLLRNILGLLLWRSLMHLRREALLLFLNSPLCPWIIRFGAACLKRFYRWWIERVTATHSTDARR